MSVKFSHIFKSLYLVLIVTLSSSLGTPSVGKSSDQNPLDIYFFNIGQGDAMLLHQVGKSAVLIDAGPLINGHIITSTLERLDIKELDGVIITHPHLDHFGGLFDLYSRISIKTFYDNGKSNPVKEYFRDYEAIRIMQDYHVLTTGKTLHYGDLVLEILHPPKTEPAGEVWNTNGSSLVLMISFNGFKLLQTGDLSGPAEQFFLRKFPDVSAHVLKVAHHGAEDATSKIFLEQVQPELAVISVSRDNWINAPSPIVLNRLTEMNINFIRTDEFGTIKLTVTTDGSFSIERR